LKKRNEAACLDSTDRPEAYATTSLDALRRSCYRAKMVGKIPQVPAFSDWADPAPKPRRRRRWRDKFREAFRGIKLGVRGHSSFAVHFFFGALVIAAAIALNCSAVEWCLLLLCIGGVITAELINSAVETLFKGLDEAAQRRFHGCLDIAAGAVLVASLFAVVIGCIIFISRIVSLLDL
jgi:diacylglycerol kinase